MISAAAVLCLTLNVYYEAPYESEAGRMAVAQVTVRRAQMAPPTLDADWQARICPVVYAPRQFSWTRSWWERGPRGFAPAPRRSRAYEAARSTARRALLWGHCPACLPDHSRGATHYHADYVRPDWAEEMEEVARIGHHIFYRAP